MYFDLMPQPELTTSPRTEGSHWRFNDLLAFNFVLNGSALSYLLRLQFTISNFHLNIATEGK